ncbi:MAG TPA: aldehyde dehydrogenase family protein [candidate division Zixibacteria bacterium]|nr:aldehyde dehydrogenase family protein [candidate division Zixibacteria bacterium]
MSSPVEYKNFINGKWVASKSGQTFENRNPADTDDVVGVFQKSTPEDVNEAIAAAAEAYKKWRLVPAPKRGEILYRIGARLTKDKEMISRDMTREMGKVIAETRGDTQEAIDMTFYMAGEGRRLFGSTTPSEMVKKFNMTIRQPLGVCSFITPWNFPIAIPSWKMMPALICGNTIVIKPATDTPMSVVHLMKVCEEEGIPPGVVNMVTGSGGTLGDALIKHPAVKVVSFTGSTAVGRKVSEGCATTFKHSCLEMGGKNVQIVMDDANLDLAIDGALWGAFGTTGQRCTATSRLIVHKKVAKEMIDRLVERAKKLKVGNGLDESVQMGPCINEGQRQTVLEYVEIGKKEGARLMTGGEPLKDGPHAKGFFVQPTVFADVNQKMRIWREEIFGPVLSIATFDDFDQAIEMANDTVYGLSASLYTQDINKAYTAMRDVYTGIFYVNAPTIGAETHLPFGGTKETGNGHREAATAALDVYSEWKSIYVDFSGVLQRAQIDNS